ncbi:MAG: hypothetical protein ACTJH7_01190 [Alcaligenes sp.]
MYSSPCFTALPFWRFRYTACRLFILAVFYRGFLWFLRTYDSRRPVFFDAFIDNDAGTTGADYLVGLGCFTFRAASTPGKL